MSINYEKIGDYKLKFIDNLYLIYYNLEKKNIKKKNWIYLKDLILKNKNDKLALCKNFKYNPYNFLFFKKNDYFDTLDQYYLHNYDYNRDFIFSNIEDNFIEKNSKTIIEPVLIVRGYRSFYTLLSNSMNDISLFLLLKSKSIRILISKQYIPESINESIIEQIKFNIIFYDPDKLYFFKKAYFFDVKDNLNMQKKINNQIINFFKKMPSFENNEIYERIYIKRKFGVGQLRILENIEEIESILKKYNFKFVSPEELDSFKRQKSIFKKCKYLVSETGSGLCNIFLSDIDCSLLSININNFRAGSIIQKFISNLLKESDCNHKFMSINCPKTFHDYDHEYKQIIIKFRINPEIFEEYINKLLNNL